MPPPNSPAVADTSPLISLDACNQFGLLRKLHAPVVVPRAVEQELSIGGATGLPMGLTRAHRKWIGVRTLRTPPSQVLVAALHLGEAEVIALALEIGFPLVLLDETAARAVARAWGLQVTGSLGVLLRAKRKGMLPAVKPSIDLMLSRGVLLGSGLIDSVLRVAGEAP
jgi:predicted nucleic acid-binding protein